MKRLAFLALVLFIAGVFLLSRRPDDTQAAQPTGEPQAVMVVQASPTPMPEPTLDYVATQVVLLDRLEAQLKENDQLRQEVSDMKAQVVQQGADATAQAWQSQETIARAKAAEEDAKARNNEAIAKIKEADNEAKALELKDKQIAVEQIDAETRSVQAKAQAQYSWLILFGLLGLSGGIVVGGRYLSQAPKKAEPKPAPELESGEPETQTVRIAHPEANAVYEHDIQITPKERAVLRRAVIELDGILSRRRLNGENPTKTVYFSEQRAEQILAELRRENPNGVSLAVFGQNNMTFAMPQLYQWLGLPSPLSVKTSPETAKKTAESHPTPPHPGGAKPENAEGEGVEPDTEEDSHE